MTAQTGTIYLLHFDRPYQHARHYIGWTTDINTRLAAHAAGHGARLLEVVRAAGIGWTLARTWTGPRARERQLKTQGGASRRCPCCGVHPHRHTWTCAERTYLTHRYLGLVDAGHLTDPTVLTRARRQLTALLTGPTHPLTPAELLGWIERTPVMNPLTYTPPYVRQDGSVWCVQEDAETGCENTCRLVVDTETGLSLFLPDYLINVHASQPAFAQTGEPWPLFRWATHTDLATPISTP